MRTYILHYTCKSGAYAITRIITVFNMIVLSKMRACMWLVTSWEFWCNVMHVNVCVHVCMHTGSIISLLLVQYPRLNDTCAQAWPMPCELHVHACIWARLGKNKNVCYVLHKAYHASICIRIHTDTQTQIHILHKVEYNSIYICTCTCTHTCTHTQHTHGHLLPASFCYRCTWPCGGGRMTAHARSISW